MQKYPLSIKIFIFTGIVCLLQVSPIPGIFLMIFAAMFWPVITINLGFVIMIFETLSRKLPRWLIIIPIIYFGGYASLTIASHIKLYQLRKEIIVKNDPIRIPFDPKYHTLLISDIDDSLSGISMQLVKSYDIPVVYEKGGLSQRISKKSTCDRANISTSGTNEFAVYDNGKQIQGLCFVQKREEPKLPIYTLTTTKTHRYNANNKTDFLLATYDIVITVTDPSGNKYELHGGTADPLKWIPMPIIGCGLGGTKWECVAEFLREDFTPINKTGDVDVIASAFGLKPVSISSRQNIEVQQ